jgi:hypothetical protein
VFCMWLEHGESDGVLGIEQHVWVVYVPYDDPGLKYKGL